MHACMHALVLCTHHPRAHGTWKVQAIKCAELVMLQSSQLVVAGHLADIYIQSDPPLPKSSHMQSEGPASHKAARGPYSLSPLSSCFVTYVKSCEGRALADLNLKRTYVSSQQTPMTACIRDNSCVACKAYVCTPCTGLPVHVHEKWIVCLGLAAVKIEYKFD